MSKKKYKIDGKFYDFNNEKFKRIVENYGNNNNKSKRKIYMDFATFCGMHVDSYKTFEKWTSKDVGPRDITYFEAIADFFKVEPSEFLDEVMDYIENKTEGVKKMDFNKFQSNDINIEKHSAKKFNSVQISEFIRVKDHILNYLYNYYSPYVDDIDTFEKDDNHSMYYFGSVTQTIAERMKMNSNYFDIDKYFSIIEKEEIEMAMEIQETYEEIINKKREEKMKYGFFKSFKIKDEEVLNPEEIEFLNNNVYKMNLLYQYEALKEIGYKIILREEIDKSLSILPYEVYNVLVRLLDILPSPYWKDEYDCYVDAEANYNIDEVILIDEYEEDLKNNRIIKSKMEGDDNYGKIRIVNGKLQSGITRDDEIKEAMNTFLDASKKDYDQIVYSINNRIMNVHRILNDIMKKYID